MGGGSKDPLSWQRLYFVVKNGLVYYYKDKQAFKTKPNKPINKRGLDLEDYIVSLAALEGPGLGTLGTEIETLSQSQSITASSMTATTKGNSSRVPVFEFLLTPEDGDDVRKVWRFRADTEIELKKWVHIFNQAISICNAHNQLATDH